MSRSFDIAEIPLQMLFLAGLVTFWPLLAISFVAAIIHGFIVESQAQLVPEATERLGIAEEDREGEAVRVAGRGWYTSIVDAQELVARLERQDREAEPGWVHMMEREVPGVYQYTAFKHPNASGLTEYRTTTTVPGVTPFEFSDFLMDDSARKNWESFSRHVSIIEQGDWACHREQVVRWIRRFPFHFLTDREYVIANQLWALSPETGLSPVTAARPGCEFYACTRGFDHHPNSPPDSGLVRTTSFNSNWRCRSVPWPDGREATEVVLLHSENIRIPEKLAQWAVRVGMPGFVRELTDGLYAYVAMRRAKGLPPDVLDPHGYGHDFAIQQQEQQQQEQGTEGIPGQVQSIVQQINQRHGEDLASRLQGGFSAVSQGGVGSASGREAAMDPRELESVMAMEAPHLYTHHQQPFHLRQDSPHLGLTLPLRKHLAKLTTQRLANGARLYQAPAGPADEGVAGEELVQGGVEGNVAHNALKTWSTGSKTAVVPEQQLQQKDASKGAVEALRAVLSYRAIKWIGVGLVVFGVRSLLKDRGGSRSGRAAQRDIKEVQGAREEDLESEEEEGLGFHLH